MKIYISMRYGNRAWFCFTMTMTTKKKNVQHSLSFSASDPIAYKNFTSFMSFQFGSILMKDKAQHMVTKINFILRQRLTFLLPNERTFYTCNMMQSANNVRIPFTSTSHRERLHKGLKKFEGIYGECDKLIFNCFHRNANEWNRASFEIFILFEWLSLYVWTKGNVITSWKKRRKKLCSSWQWPLFHWEYFNIFQHKEDRLNF